MTVITSQWAQLVRLELHYEKAHEAIAADHGPYYYLSFIGTAPEARGRGLGSKLLQEITSRADREGRWCLLEATSEKSEVSGVVVVVGNMGRVSHNRHSWGRGLYGLFSQYSFGCLSACMPVRSMLVEHHAVKEKHEGLSICLKPPPLAHTSRLHVFLRTCKTNTSNPSHPL